MKLDPQKLKAEQDLLSALESDGAVTQMTLSKRLGVSIGFVNALIKRAARKGYVKIRTAPYKRYAYYLTPEGFAEKCRLVSEYLDHSLNFFRRARLEYLDLFQFSRAQGARRGVLAGAGELGEIAYLAAQEAEFEIVAVLEPGSARSRFCGAPVISDLSDSPTAFDCVVLTDQSTPQRIFDALSRTHPEIRILVPSLLRIVEHAHEQGEVDA